MSISRSDIYNEQLQEKQKNFKWTMPEFEYLAKVISELKRDKIGNVNKMAGERLDRYEQAIQKIKTKSEYKQTERRVKEQMVVKEAEASTLLDVDKSYERKVENSGLAEDRQQLDKVGNQQIREVPNAQTSYSEILTNTSQVNKPIMTVRSDNCTDHRRCYPLWNVSRPERYSDM